MKVKVEKLEGSKAKLEVVLTKEEFNEKYEKAFDKVIKDVEIKGFRKGKVPRQMYLKRFGEGAILQEAIDIALNETYYTAVTSKKVEVVSQPEIDVDFEKLGKDKPFKYTAVVEVYPEVTLGKYYGVEVVKESDEISEEEINSHIERELKNNSELEVVEGKPLEKGNTAVFDFTGYVDGVEFEGGKAENYSLEIGSGQFIPGFEDQMIGMEVNETRNINVKFPEDYHAEELKGKDAVFEVVLHEIKNRVVPTLSDEFVKEELEIKDVNNVKEYKAYIKEIITKEKTEASENKFADDVITLAMENANVDVPEGMIDTEVNHQVKQIERQAKAYNMPVDVLLKYSGLESLEAYKEAIRPSALMSVKQRLVFSEIAKVEKIKVTKADFEKEIKLIAKEVNKTVEEVKAVYTKEALSPYILLQKAIELVKTSAVDKAKKEVEEEK